MNPLWKLLTSLRLTVVLLGLAIVLVFFGTLAQVDLGLYGALERWFRSLIIIGKWKPNPESSFFIPWVFPGGYAIGSALLINLISAHIRRFKWGWSKVGIHLAHVGIIILLAGQLATDMTQVESRMSFIEGSTVGYLERHRAHELAITTDAEGGKEDVVVIPEAMLKPKDNKNKDGVEITYPKLPFAVRIKAYHENSEVRQRGPVVDKDEPVPATQGIGTQVVFKPKSEARDMDTRNLPVAIVEITEGGKSLGTWLTRVFLDPQEFTAAGKTWRLTLREERTYLPYSFKLLQATHKKYAGVDVAKDFRSKVQINNPGHDTWETEISMNSPLRYEGLAFFQYQMTKEEFDRSPGSSILQVVRNPSWLAPYIGCIVVMAGLLWQFLHHLVGFISKRRSA